MRPIPPWRHTTQRLQPCLQWPLTWPPPPAWPAERRCTAPWAGAAAGLAFCLIFACTSIYFVPPLWTEFLANWHSASWAKQGATLCSSGGAGGGVLLAEGPVQRDSFPSIRQPEPHSLLQPLQPHTLFTRHLSARSSDRRRACLNTRLSHDGALPLARRGRALRLGPQWRYEA